MKVSGTPQQQSLSSKRCTFDAKRAQTNFCFILALEGSIWGLLRQEWVWDVGLHLHWRSMPGAEPDRSYN